MVEKLKKENAELKRLMRMAMASMTHAASCKNCEYKHCYCCCECTWKWQHADEVEEIEELLSEGEYEITYEEALERIEKESAIDALILFRQLWCMDKKSTEKNDEPCFRCSVCPMKCENKMCDAKMLILEHGTEDQKNRMNVMW